MQINKLSQPNSTNFNGYVNVKCIDGKLVRVKKGMPGSINMFVAGGKGVDEKVALANKNLVLKSMPYPPAWTMATICLARRKSKSILHLRLRLFS